MNECPMQSLLLVNLVCVYIYIYIFLLNTLSSGKSCLVAPGAAVLPWATETVLSPWLAADEGRVSHVLSHTYDEKKKNHTYHLLVFNTPETTRSICTFIFHFVDNGIAGAGELCSALWSNKRQHGIYI